MMDSLYVLEQGAFLKREGAALKVVKGSEVIDEIPAEGLKRLLLVGWVSLTGGVMDFLIRNRVETVFVTPTGRFRARLALDEHAHVARRRAQYMKLSDPSFAKEAAGRIVEGKLRNMGDLMLLRARRYGDPGLREACARVRGFLGLLRGARDVEAVRGIEGAASRAYFEVFGRFLRNDEFRFQGRNKRPPLDPVNALLSFVYTLLTNEVLSAIQACGLDPYLGALHEVAYGRPSLACDLVEEYRAFLGDRLVLGVLNRKAVSPDDFVFRKAAPKSFVDKEDMERKRPVEMKPATRKTLVAAYETMMGRSAMHPGAGKRLTYRNIILQQVRDFGRYLEDPAQVYSPFHWEN